MSRNKEYGSVLFPDADIIKEITLNNGNWYFYGFGFDFGYEETYLAPGAGCATQKVSLEGFPKLIELNVDEEDCGFINNTRYFAGTFDTGQRVSPFNRIKFEICDGRINDSNECDGKGKSGSMKVIIPSYDIANGINRSRKSAAKEYVYSDNSGNKFTCIPFANGGPRRYSNGYFALPISYGLSNDYPAPLEIEFYLGSRCEGAPHNTYFMPFGITWSDTSRAFKLRGNIPNPTPTQEIITIAVRDDLLLNGAKCAINDNCSSGTCNNVTNRCQ